VVSEFAFVELPDVTEAEINPVLMRGEWRVGVDSLVVLGLPPS
jgi:hypothetical protein